MAIVSNVSHQNPIPIIIDTDPGEDADDAVTLTMGIHSKEVSIELIVTTNEDVDEETGKGQYAAYAEEVLRRWGADYKVYQGASLGNHKFICGIMLPDDWKTHPKADTDFLPRIKEILETHEKVIYLSIGPMTNLARLLDQPWFKEGGLRDRVTIVQMGGWLEPGRVEYNIQCDPISAKKVFHSGLPIYLVTYGTTSHEKVSVPLDGRLYTDLNTSEHSGHQLLASAYRSFREKYHFDSCLNDPLTLAAVFRDYVQFDKKKVEVDENTGATYFSDEGADIFVSRDDFDHDGFMEFVRERLQLS